MHTTSHSQRKPHLWGVVLVVIVSLSLLCDATPNSICQDTAGVKSIRACAADCVGCGPNSGKDQIAYVIGCGDAPPNECYCRSDLFPLAYSGLEKCISRSCTLVPAIGSGSNADLSGAVGFYTNYCQGAGYTISALGVSTTGTGMTGTSLPPTTSLPTVPTSTSTSTPTPTNAKEENTSNASSSSGMTSSDRIALGVGIGVGLPATIAAVITCVVVLKKARMDSGARMGTGGGN